MALRIRHIRYINFLPLNYGARNIWISLLVLLTAACEIPPGREVYNAAFLMEKNEQFPLGWEYERGHPESITKQHYPSIRKWKPQISGEQEHPVIFSQRVILDSGSYQVIGKFDLSISEGTFFVSATSEGHMEQIRFQTDKATCKRVLFDIHNYQPSIWTLRIGFEQNSEGHALLDTLYTTKEDFFKELTIDPREMRRTISEEAGISEFDSSNFDRNVDQLAAGLNAAFLATESQPSVFGDALFDTESTRFLFTYAQDEDVGSGYGPKSSLSLDEILKLYRIPVRQLHWTRECFGFHQFLEYWNPYDRRWKIIDPCFGVRYVDENGTILGFEGVQRLVLEQNFDSTNIDVLNMDRLYYSQEEILTGWQEAELAVNIILK